MRLRGDRARRYHRWRSGTCTRCGDARHVELGPKGGKRYVYDYAGDGFGPRRDCDRGQPTLTPAVR